ncbi:MAG: 2-oxo acid dehydrogenase subunit E2 [Clostridiaceae bacterium]|nr:2-oxo acid dehydrogenase subunit E2 [Clostridiaceae bacterium]
MVKQIKMPNAGQTTDRAVITKLKVARGDKVNRGDILMEVETDKAILPIESYTSGIVLDILVSEGDTVSEGVVLVVLGDQSDLESYQGKGQQGPGADIEPVRQEPAQSVEDDEYIPILKGPVAKEGAEPAEKAPVDKTPVESKSTEYPAMPNAKKLAREANVDLSLVKPAKGTIIKKSDVEAYIKAHQEKTPDAAQEYEVLPMTKMRAAIARRMLESVRTIPAFQVTFSIDMTKAIALRDEIARIHNSKVSYNDIIAKALAVTAKRYPLLNARYEGDEIRIYKHTNIGLAVSVDGGLVVPVVRNVDSMSLEEISKAYKDKIEKARSGMLTTDEMGCGSVTISNLGMYDVDHFTAIINPPESCIFALGSISMNPVYADGEWKSVPIMKVTASFDHRIIDGAYGAQITRTLKALVENPVLMLY